jgi:NAD(P)-dependent dehydrogenase (short-subunit alcohol dehydrogenase family)
MAINVKAVFYCTAGLTDLLAKDATNLDPGRVIVISSTAAFQTRADDTGLQEGGTGLWSYMTSKAGVVSLAKTMATTLASKHIVVNTICPGVFPSRMANYGIKKNKDELLAKSADGRLGIPEDLAGTALFLVSKCARCCLL